MAVCHLEKKKCPCQLVVYHTSRMVPSLFWSFNRQGCPFKDTFLIYPLSSFSPVQHIEGLLWHTPATVRQKAAAVEWRTKSHVSKQSADLWSHTYSKHISHTASVCGGSVESAVRGVCVVLVSIMLSFSVPFLGSSLRRTLCLHDLHLLTEM